MLDSRDISLLRPDVAANCRIWQERCRAAGLNVLVTNTVRDKEYQEYLYAQGRTRPGNIVTNGRTPTFHSDKAGLAWDFCKNVRGQEYNDPDFFRRAAGIAKEMGFSWGGDWRSFPDSPHIQWDNHGHWTSSMILAGKLPPDMPQYQKEDDMNQDKFNQMFKTAVEAYRKELRDNDSGQWSKEAREYAVSTGLFAGSGTTPDGQPNYMWEDLLTREQAAHLFYQFAQQNRLI